MAVCAEPCSHYIITAVDSCRSFQLYKQRVEREAAGQRKGYRFRLDGLLPEDWASLMEQCRALSHPQKAFNFSSPGDLGTPQGSEAFGAAPPAPTIENGAYMHVVERSAGDFVPNNMIYHHLQKYTTNSAGPVAGFAALVKEAQSQPAQSAAEATTVAAGEPLPAAEKAALDPLASSEEARAKSAANEGLDVWRASNTDKDVFTFYPFPCPVAASIPYRSRHFCVMVNLKPIVPNHLMVVPLRCVGTVHALKPDEVADWGRTVALTIRVLNEVRRRQSPTVQAAEGNYSVAIQQGELAGQTVPHLHTHVIPFDPSGKLAGEPESEEGEQLSRPPRTMATMQEETNYFKPIFKELEQAL